MVTFVGILLTSISALTLGAASDENRYAVAASALDVIIAQQYAYLDKLPDGILPQSTELTREREAVHDQRSLLLYAEKRIASLADHHANTGSSFDDSWAVIPTYADLWIRAENDHYVIVSVREDSPAAKAGLSEGQRITRVNDVPIKRAVADFWNELGLSVTPRRAAYAASVLIAGRRDRDRQLTVSEPTGTEGRHVLPNLYADQLDRPPVSVKMGGGKTTLLFNNSLGDNATIAAFDESLGQVPAGSDLILDLRDTPSGGNTTIARAIMGWFVKQPHSYQIHNRPAQERETGIARQWVEQVLPREGKYRKGLPTILVGHWTGSMGEGLAVGFASLGASVRGSRMAGLNGAVEDIHIGDTELMIKLPTERLMTPNGLPREDFEPQPIK